MKLSVTHHRKHVFVCQRLCWLIPEVVCYFWAWWVTKWETIQTEGAGNGGKSLGLSKGVIHKVKFFTFLKEIKRLELKIWLLHCVYLFTIKIKLSLFFIWFWVKRGMIEYLFPESYQKYLTWFKAIVSIILYLVVPSRWSEFPHLIKAIPELAMYLTHEEEEEEVEVHFPKSQIQSGDTLCP